VIKIVSLFLSLALLMTSCMDSSDESTITELHISSGAVRGVYYPVAHAVAKAVNDDQRDLGYHMSVSSSHGSIANINNILTGNADFAIVQYDVLLAARNGEGGWEGLGGENVVAIARLYDEAVTLVAAANSDWQDVRELKQARVGVGSQGSGHYHNAQQVLSAMENQSSVQRDTRVTASALAAVGGELDAAF
jgi:TRAP transporter TAXI family solute receptor